MKSNFFLLLSIIALIFFWQQKNNNLVNIYFLDIGQGDAIYFKTPNGQDGLIDGGPGDKVLGELGSVMSLGDKKIDLMIATHPDADHIGGLPAVLERYDVTEIWINGATNDTKIYNKLLDAINNEKAQGATVKVVVRGDRKDFGATHLRVLAPFESFEGKQPNEQNEGSIVARLEYNNFSVLLTGDAEFPVEDKLVAGKSDLFPLESTILKVGHHGSAGSTSEEFLQAVDPKKAVISTGKNNRYGHPTKRVLDLLEKYKIPTYRTDQDGRVEIESNGKDYFIF